MKKLKFEHYPNEKGDYTIVYGLNTKFETITGVAESWRMAQYSCAQLNSVLKIERRQQ